MSRTPKSLILILSILILSFIPACKPGNTTPVVPTDQTQEPIVGNTAYPVEIDQPQSSGKIDEMYPLSNYDPLSSFPLKVDVPEPAAGLGVIFGKVLSISEGDKPFLNASLYLGSYIAPNEGGDNSPLLVGISPDEDPKAEQAQDGSFVFKDVPPGKYGLFLYTPMSAFLMTDAKTGEYINVEVVAGQTINLGILYVE
ncbi:MAG: hypothetical protein MUO40_09220 [Anaerolineaceae bacterium]|nr:hypothetical protein [Anaerolineaceae bacterium]